MSNRLLCILSILLLFLSSCTKDETIEAEENKINELTEYDFEVMDYFKEIALGSEFGDASRTTRRWEQEMKIFIGGESEPELLDEFKRIKEEIHSLVNTDFRIEVVNDSMQANYYMFFGSKDQFDAIYPETADSTEDNWGLFYLNWNASQNLIKGRMYVDTERANITEQKHLLREELTQSLGLARDSELYSGSIFQSSWTVTNQYDEIDKELISLLYHPSMRSGLNDSQVEEILIEILSEED